MSRKSNPSYTLFALTEWAVPPSGGRGRKATGKQRFIVQLADARNWTMAIEREGYPPVGEKFSGTLGMLLPNAPAIAGVSFYAALAQAIAALQTITGEKYEVGEQKSLRQTIDEFDAFYKTDLYSDEMNPKLLTLIGVDNTEQGDEE